MEINYTYTSIKVNKVRLFFTLVVISAFLFNLRPTTLAHEGHPDENLDPSFGTDGKVVTDFTGSTDVGLAMVIQPDGKILVGGSTANTDTNGTDYGLARYNSEGSLDQTFGTGGKVLTDVGGQGDFIAAIALQSDGKIVAAGRAGSFLHPDFGLARFLTSSFDLCLQEDRNGNLLRLNTTTGEYQFQNCSKGLRVADIGAVTINGCKVTFTDSGVNPKSPDRNIQASINLCTKAATAGIVWHSPFSRSEINDQNITNNLCLCP